MDEFSEFESDLSMSIDEITSHNHRLNAIAKFAPKYEVKLVKNNQYKGYYRVGKMPNFDENLEKYNQFTQQYNEDMQFSSQDSGWFFLILLSPFLVLAILLAIFFTAVMVPVLIVGIPVYLLLHYLKILSYKAGFFPSKILTEVDHVYVHPDGTIVVPIGGKLQPFTFEVKGDMVLETHFQDGVRQSISMLRGRRQYFMMKTGYHRSLNVQAVNDYLEGFGLRTKVRRTTSDSGGGGGGG